MDCENDGMCQWNNGQSFCRPQDVGAACGTLLDEDSCTAINLCEWDADNTVCIGG
jgi:hypothetical protein